MRTRPYWDSRPARPPTPAWEAAVDPVPVRRTPPHARCSPQSLLRVALRSDILLAQRRLCTSAMRIATRTAVPTTTEIAMQGTQQQPTSQPAAYTPTDRTVPTRSADRASYDRGLVLAILDEGSVCHLGVVRVGSP